MITKEQAQLFYSRGDTNQRLLAETILALYDEIARLQQPGFVAAGQVEPQSVRRKL